ncbi:MAG: HD-GYP domain-containing protein [Bacillota bacterium]
MKNAVIRKFSVVSFLVFFGLTVGLSLAVSGFLTREILNILAHLTGEYVQGMVHNQVKVEKISESHYDDYARILKQGMLGEKILGIMVWDTQGKIIFSDDPKIIGQQFPLSPDLKKALDGDMLAEVTKQVKTQINLGEKNGALKVLTPIKSTRGITLGVYEIYWDMSLLRQAASKAFYLVNIILIAGFVFLYIILFRFFKAASDTIEDQSEELTTLQIRLDASQEHGKGHLETIKALLAALNAKDQYTAGHSVRVADIALKIGRELGLSDVRLKVLEEAALFHDIGKIGITEVILNKPGRLSTKEFEVIKEHPVIGSDIISTIDNMEEQSLIVRHHHERFDGFGYPDELDGETIPLESRILAVADTFDAITSERPYHHALQLAKARDILIECKGTQLDPLVVDAFLAITVGEAVALGPVGGILPSQAI